MTMLPALEVSDHVATVAFDGPISLPWAEALADATSEIGRRDDVRVVLLRGTGRFFCPGGDLGALHPSEAPGNAAGRLAATLHTGLLQLAAGDAPVVARVHGAAAGAGLSLVLAADIVVAARSASFTTAFTAVGLTVDGGGSWLLPRVVGLRRATELMLTSRRVDADEAERIGIVTTTVEDDDLDAAVDEVVQQLRRGPTAAYGTVRRLLRTGATTSFPDHLDAELRAVVSAANSAEGRAGVAAFADRRPPVFPGLEDQA